MFKMECSGNIVQGGPGSLVACIRQDPLYLLDQFIFHWDHDNRFLDAIYIQRSTR